MKIMIGIPAYNEEKHIGNLFEDILNQRVENKFDILVVSDDSSDKTDDIVQSYVNKYDNIKLVKKEIRTGKSSTMNVILDYAKDYDVLIFLDADIRLADNALNLLIKKFFEKDVDLVAGNMEPMPIKLLNIGGQAAYFKWAFGNEIKETHRYSIYHTNGCILALSRRLHDGMRISLGIGDDAYIYLCCIQKNLIFEYEPKALVYYELVDKMKDHLKKNFRTTSTFEDLKKIFGDDLVDTHARINNKFSIFLRSSLRYPYKSLCWTLLYSYGKIFARHKRESTPLY